MEGVTRPDGAPLVSVPAPSPKGLGLDAWSTCGVKTTGVGATRAVTVTVALVEAFVGTDATAGLVGVDGGVTRGGGWDTGGVWVIGDTTFTGLCGFGRTKGGGALTVGEVGREALVFGASSVVDGNCGFAVELEGREDGGMGVIFKDCGAAEGASFCGEVKLGVTVDTVVLGVFCAGLGGGTGSGGAGTVLTMGIAGEGPPTVNAMTYLIIFNRYAF